jgi:tRNA A22 N-methylase
MVDFATKILSVKLDLNLIFEKFQSLEEGNFNESINQIKTLALQVNKKKEELRSQLSIEEHKKFNLELEDVTKKIKKCFDNIVEEKENEIKKVSFELNKLTNQKKLALYKR